jgi:hypothetical protein
LLNKCVSQEEKEKLLTMLTHLRIAFQNGRGKLDQKDRLFVPIVKDCIMVVLVTAAHIAAAPGGIRVVVVVFPVFECHGVGRHSCWKSGPFQ